jgi:type IV pilus assembly protein PilC
VSKIDLAKYKDYATGETAGEEKGGIASILNKEITLFGKRFDAKRKEWFYSELSILLSSGIDTKASLELIAEEAKKGKEKEILTKLKDQVIAGKNISEVLKTFPEFSSYEYHSVEIGEETGRLDEVLKELALFYTNQVKLKRQITSTLSYPIAIIVIAFGSVSFMLTSVVPMFRDIFARMGGELPGITKFMLRLSDFISGYFLLFLLVVGGITFFIYSQRKKDWFRKYSSALVLRLPLIGPMISKIYLARFCQSMKLLLGSKTKLIDALELIERMIAFYPLEVALRQVREDVFQGKTLNESLSGFKIFNKRMISLIKVSEEVNQPEKIFEKLAQQMSEEVDHQNAVISKLIEPIFIVVLGSIVGFILIAMYLPMFKLSTTIGG